MWNGLNKYLNSINGKEYSYIQKNGETNIGTGKSWDIEVFVTPYTGQGDDCSGVVRVNHDRKVIMFDEVAPDYKVSDAIRNLLDNGYTTDIKISEDGNVLREELNQEKKENIKTGIQLFISALSSLAMIIFPAICGAAGVAVASGVIAAGAAVNTGFGVVRTGKLTKKASLLRRDEIMAELLRNKDVRDLKESLLFLNGDFEAQKGMVDLYLSGNTLFYEAMENVKQQKALVENFNFMIKK